MKPVQMEQAPKGKKTFSLEVHELEVPTGCCPVSKNPFEGSMITISYLSRNCLEVGSIFTYLHSFVGGQQDSEGEIIVRDMEGMICAIAQESARCLHVVTFVYARLVIRPKEIMHLWCIGLPWK